MRSVAIRNSLVSLAFGVSLAPRATAAEVVATKAASVSASDLHTSSHVGFAVADQSSTGFRAVGGTLVFLDISHSLSRACEIGLRSMGQGGKADQREFYRLGAGPLVTWHVAKDWVVQGSLALFNETGLGSDGHKAYQSRGQQAMLGWEKSWALAPRVEVAWGGFVTYHRGTLSSAAASVAAATNLVNSGLTHGAEIALRLSL